MKMSSLLAVVVLMGLAQSGFAQTVTCKLNESKSAAMIKKMGGGRKKSKVQVADANSFQLIISESSIVGGYLKDAGNGQAWELDKAGPDEGQRNAPDYTKRDVKSSGGVIRTGLDIDGWDHFNYSISINSKSKTAEVREDVQLDCLDPYTAFGAYDCEISE
jgi:opacity protein-like surface antigen